MSDSIPSNISLQTGHILLGNFFAYALYGVLVFQVGLYHYIFPKDFSWMKYTVWSTFLIDTVMTVCGTIAAWNTLAVGWGKMIILTQASDWAFVSLPCLSASVALVVHFFYCWRVWKLYESLILPMIISTISIFSFVAATVSGYYVGSLRLAQIYEVRPWVVMWLGTSLLVDSLITSLMVYGLLEAKRYTTYKSTSSRLSGHIVVTIESGMLVVIGASIQLLCFMLFNERGMHFFPSFLPKLYSNTLLATLNMRLIIREKHPQIETGEPRSLMEDRHSRPLNENHSQGSLPSMGVHVSVVTRTEREDSPIPGLPAIFDLNMLPYRHR